MKYALLIHELAGATDAMSDDEREAISAEYMQLMHDERVVGGDGLHPAATATTVRVSDGDTLLTDGPFADTKEVLGGFYIVDAADLDGALEIAGQIPAARLGGCVEVRAIVER